MPRSTPGDVERELFCEGRGDLHALAERILRDHALAEDVVQESWLRWREKGSGARVARALLRRIVRNLAIDRLRHERSERARQAAVATSEPWSLDAEETVTHRQRLARAQEALNELPDRTRRAFVLRRIEGRSLAEVASALDVSVPRAHQMVARAIAHIAIKIKD
ncbi:MAG: sigma-70 family RNA polymerase sigma factor [Pseudomonadota bacterium]